MRNNESLEGPIGRDRLTPERLARRFGARSEVARSGVPALYEAIAGSASPQVAAALQQWKDLLGTASGHDLDRPGHQIGRFAQSYGIPAEGLRPAGFLFAVHTYYALVVKLLVRQVMGTRSGRRPLAEGTGVATGEDLRRTMEALEGGPAGVLRRACEEMGTGTSRQPDFAGFGATSSEPVPISSQARSVIGSAGENPFGWYTATWSPALERLVRQVSQCMARCAAEADKGPASGSCDLLKGLYEGLLPKQLRHRLGEYYTPDWLAEHLLDESGFTGEPGTRLLDPACGSGTFLVLAIRRMRRAMPSDRLPLFRRELLGRILDAVVGFDLNPLAVLAARANYLMAVRDLLDEGEEVEIPVHLRDAILPLPGDEHAPGGQFDYVVGNPPWIVWDHLPEAYRRATRPLWEQYGLFSLSGSDARHGGGKKDLSMLMTYVAADRYLKRGGRLAFVLTQTLFQTKGAGDGFRRFRLGRTGEPLKVLRVDDMVRLRPFAGAANWTATLVLEKGLATTYPVPYVKWVTADDREGSRQPCLAEPIEPEVPSSPWFVRPEGFQTPLGSLIGPSDYTAHLGANSGGANGVYWVELIERTDRGVLVRNRAEKNRRDMPEVTAVIEPDLIYPLLRWGDVGRWRAVPSGHVLLVQDLQLRRGIDPEIMQREYPATLDYLRRFERLLRGRAAYQRYQHAAAFYSMYNVGTYTAAPWKVVWRRMDRRVRAAVAGPVDDPLLGRRPAVPQETCVLLAVDSPDEAHYACAVLNSAVVDFLVRAHSVRGGKGFGTPSMLDYVRLRRFDPNDRRHAELARRGRQASETAAAGGDVAATEHQIDRLAGALWELGEDEMEAIRREVAATP